MTGVFRRVFRRPPSKRVVLGVAAAVAVRAPGLRRRLHVSLVRSVGLRIGKHIRPRGRIILQGGGVAKPAVPAWKTILDHRYAMLRERARQDANREPVYHTALHPDTNPVFVAKRVSLYKPLPKRAPQRVPTFIGAVAIPPGVSSPVSRPVMPLHRVVRIVRSRPAVVILVPFAEGLPPALAFRRPLVITIRREQIFRDIAARKRPTLVLVILTPPVTDLVLGRVVTIRTLEGHVVTIQSLEDHTVTIQSLEDYDVEVP